MSNIQISDLQPTGADLFNDSENFMADLTEEELEVHGGATPTSPIVSVVLSIAYSVSIIASAARSNPKSPHRPPQN